jgi:hypothetical protein
MKKETILLIGFWVVIAVVIFFVVKTIRQYNTAIKISKGELPLPSAAGVK